MKSTSSRIMFAALAISAFVQTASASLNEEAPGVRVPDNGASIGMLLLAVAGLVALRRTFTRR